MGKKRLTGSDLNRMADQGNREVGYERGEVDGEVLSGVDFERMMAVFSDSQLRDYLEDLYLKDGGGRALRRWGGMTDVEARVGADLYIKGCAVRNWMSPFEFFERMGAPVVAEDQAYEKLLSFNFHLAIRSLLPKNLWANHTPVDVMAFFGFSKATAHLIIPSTDAEIEAVEKLRDVAIKAMEMMERSGGMVLETEGSLGKDVEMEIMEEHGYGSKPYYQALRRAGLTCDLVAEALASDIRSKPENRIRELQLASKILGLERPSGTININPSGRGNQGGYVFKWSE